MYVYIESEPGRLWTAGFYATNLKFIAESDHTCLRDAVERVRHLNGGNETAPPKKLDVRFTDAMRLDMFTASALTGLLARGSASSNANAAGYYAFKAVELAKATIRQIDNPAPPHADPLE